MEDENMTTKELAVLFSACKVPAPEMELMINKHVENELKDFKLFFNSEYEYPMTMMDEHIDNYLQSKK